MKPVKIRVYNETTQKIRHYTALLKRIFRKIEQSQKMQIIFVDQQKIHELNLTYRHMDRPTDVLSFVNDDPNDDSLGDIFISFDQAIIQATEYDHSLDREIGFLAVHGYLHLIGYDHHTPEEEKEMFAEQERILLASKLERKSK